MTSKHDISDQDIRKDYRLGVGILLLNKDNKVFVGKRIDSVQDQKYNSGKLWQMPQGGIEHKEDTTKAALRELYEETGAKNVEVVAQSKDFFIYHLPSELSKKLWSGRYKGQAQKWFVMRHLGQDSEFNLKVDVQEFSEWKWVDIDELTNLAVEFKKEMYVEIVAWARGYVK